MEVFLHAWIKKLEIIYFRGSKTTSMEVDRKIHGNFQKKS